jgi:hypothetical protein
MNKFDYAKNRLNNMIDDFGKVECFYHMDGKIIVEFENGMYLVLSDEEVNHHAILYLESEIERVKH